MVLYKKYFLDLAILSKMNLNRESNFFRFFRVIVDRKLFAISLKQGL